MCTHEVKYKASQKNNAMHMKTAHEVMQSYVMKLLFHKMI